MHGTPVIKVATGHQHTVFISRTRQVWRCGSGRQGNVGNGWDNNPNLIIKLGYEWKPTYIVPTLFEELVDIVDVVCGIFHTLLLSDMKQFNSSIFQNSCSAS